MRYGRIKHVVQLLAIGESTGWLWVQQGRLPRPTKLSPRVSVWDMDLIETLVKQWGIDAAKGHDVSQR